MVDVPPRAKRVAKESWLTYLQRGMPESDGNPIAQSDKVFFTSLVESDKFLAIVKSYGNPITESDKFFLVLAMVKSDANSIAESDNVATT